jgi:hypothetical protein
VRSVQRSLSMFVKSWGSMRYVLYFLGAAIIAVFSAASAGAAFAPPLNSAFTVPASFATSIRGFSGGGGHARSGLASGRSRFPIGMPQPLARKAPARSHNSSYTPSVTEGRGGTQQDAKTAAPSFAIRHVWGSDRSLPSNIEAHVRHAPENANEQISRSAHLHRLGQGLQDHPARDYLPGRITLFNNHPFYNGHRFGLPPHHLDARLAKLRDHKWHRHYKRFDLLRGGAVACAACRFSVPNDVFWDFLGTAGGASPLDSAAALYGTGQPDPYYAEDEQGLADLASAEPAGGKPRLAHGWDEAVAILEKAAAEDEKEAEDAKSKGNDIAVIDQADEYAGAEVRERRRG